MRRKSNEHRPVYSEIHNQHTFSLRLFLVGTSITYEQRPAGEGKRMVQQTSHFRDNPGSFTSSV